MKLPIAVAILLTSPISHDALSVHPHGRRYNDVVINTALSSTAYDQRAPPVSVSENYNNQEEIEYITSALLEPPVQDELENGYYSNSWGENYEEQYEQQLLMNQQPTTSAEPQFRNSPHNENRQYQQLHHHRVMTGAERRSTWESYATPGIPGRSFNSNYGGIIGSPNGIGDWEYTSMYDPATSVHYEQPETAAYTQPTKTVEASYSSSPRKEYNMGNTIAIGGQYSFNRQSYHNMGGSIMTGSQRRAGFQNLHSYEPISQAMRYHSPDPAYEMESNSYEVESDIRESAFKGVQSSAHEAKIEMPQEFHMNHADQSTDENASLHSIKPAPAFKLESSSQLENTMPENAGVPQSLSPMIPKSGVPKIPSLKVAPSLKRSKSPSSRITGMETGGSSMPKGPGHGLKGKEINKVAFGGMKSGANPFSKSNNGPSFKAHSSPSFNAPKLPINGMQKNADSIFVKQSSKGILDMKEAGVGSFVKSNSAPPFKGAKAPLSKSIFSQALPINSMKKSSQSIEIKRNGVSKNVVSGGMKAPYGSLFGMPKTNTAFKGVKTSSFSKGPSASIHEGIKTTPLKGEDRSSLPTNVLGSGDSIKNTNFDLRSKGVNKGIFSSIKAENAQGVGAFETSNVQLKGARGNLSGLFGKKSNNSGAAPVAKVGGASATSSKFQPFVPTPNEASIQEQHNSDDEKPKNFVDFARGQGSKLGTQNTVASSPGLVNGQGTARFNGFKQTPPHTDSQISRQEVTYGALGEITSFNGFKQKSAVVSDPNSMNTKTNKFKPFVPSYNAKQAVEEDEAPAKQDLASFLQNPQNTKRNTKEVAASLSALSSQPIFYNDFESTEIANEPTYLQSQSDPNFAINNGAVQEMPSATEVPMNTPARKSLPSDLSLHPIPGKGLGVITNKAFKIGEFVGNYEGEIMSEEVKDRRYLKSLEHKLTDEDRQWIDSRLSRGQGITGTYLYGVDLDGGDIYKHFGRKGNEDEDEATPERIFVDAEDEYESLWTRFINHASPPLDNLKPMSVPESYDGKPRVWFMAKRDIEPGEELCFDYGDDYWLEGDEVF